MKKGVKKKKGKDEDGTIGNNVTVFALLNI